MDPLTRTFAHNLRALRRGGRFTQQQFAQLTGLSSSYVSMLERAKRSPPFPTLSKIAKVLKVQPGYLLQALDLAESTRALRGASGPRRRP